ncbi:protein indeterminate-domain 11-like isoform X2 [Telopea speciosissima]|uniref:protein indeterminate-domain 11-like isoform X2 n=1 Tax=Telopea speciosissima TaxID=54955 RepID=UPI001CC5933D|nr:protein indeterminate-domain 11-like isoform X2 [Telopea speciosissima]
MMMKGLMLQQQPVVEENMSNLTSASTNQTPVVKKKRNLPGNPDPDAEVIALSPKSLMATNRFICEICNKGFQRDQNLQLHRRGHNLPWKLKQRTSKEVRKRVYVCPEATCVHHDPSRALGDLTGIKKHFSRKHGEKKWKCDKCSKHYAVQADWKAHSKTCGTREYRCDCGTLFSRRDSFITHRAFCDALSEESARTITANPFLSSQSNISTSHINLQPQFNGHVLQALSLKREQQQPQYFNLKPEIPPWLACSSSTLGAGPGPPTPPPPIENPNPSPSPSFSHYHPSASLHMSATALLQSAAQMGSTMSKPSSSAMFIPHQAHMSANIGLSSREEMESGIIHGLGSFRDKASVDSDLMDHISATTNAGAGAHPSLLQDMMSSFSSASGVNSSSFGDGFGGFLSSKRDLNPIEHETFSKSKTTPSITHHSRHDEGGGGGGGGNGGDGLTRDFLGLKAFSHTDIFNIVGLDHCMNSSAYDHHTQNNKQWQG